MFFTDLFSAMHTSARVKKSLKTKASEALKQLHSVYEASPVTHVSKLQSLLTMCE
jgi:hypothetical protein